MLGWEGNNSPKSFMHCVINHGLYFDYSPHGSPASLPHSIKPYHWAKHKVILEMGKSPCWHQSSEEELNPLITDAPASMWHMQQLKKFTM